MKKYRSKTLLLAGFLGSALLFSACAEKHVSTSSISTTPAGTGAETHSVKITQDDSEKAVDTEPAEVPPKAGLIRSSLTHEWITEDAEAQRPLACMFPTDKKAQPQYGIDRAEILYEILEEGDMSRQMMIIKDWKDLNRIGNFRSIRDYYVQTGLEWDPIFLHAGGPEVFVKEILTRKDVDNINGVGGPMGPDYGAYFRIPEGSRSEHTLYSDASHLQKALEKSGFQSTHRDFYVANHFRFSHGDTVNDLSDYANAFPAAVIDMSGSFPVSKSTYTYNPEDHQYYRSMYNTAQRDAISGNQLHFANVLVEACYWGDRGLSYKLFQTIDSGRHGYFFTEGKMIPVTWKKTSEYEPTRFYDANGQEIRLNTGRTAINIIRDGTDYFLVDGTRYE